MTGVERAELEREEEDDEIKWVVCEPVWTVLVGRNDGEPKRREIVPGVNAVAAWCAERDAVRRLTVVKRQRFGWQPE